jgi:integrase
MLPFRSLRMEGTAGPVAWLRQLPPSSRHPKPRWQVRYRDPAGRERSGGIYRSEKAAERAKRRIERGQPPEVRQRAARNGQPTTPSSPAAPTPVTFGDYVEGWWPTYEQLYPASAPQLACILNHRLLPAFGHLPLADLGADQIAAWKASLVAEGRKPRTVNTYLAKLGMLLNAAVDAGYLDRNPMLRPTGRRVPLLKPLPEGKVDTWLTHEQVYRLAEAIDPRYRAVVLLGAATGLRFQELAGLLWSAVDLDRPMDDGAVAGPGRLAVLSAISDPTRSGNGVRTTPKTAAGRRLLALPARAVDALQAHQRAYGDDPQGRVFTSAGGGGRPGGTLAARNFRRVWQRASRQAALDQEVGSFGPHILRHTHATWLIALGRPINAVAARLGHASATVTLDVYASVIRLSEAGAITLGELALLDGDRRRDNDTR